MGWGLWGALGGLAGYGLDWLARRAPARLWPEAERRRSLAWPWRLAAVCGLGVSWSFVGAGRGTLLQQGLLSLWLAGLLCLALIDLQYHLLPHSLTFLITAISLAGHFGQATALGVWSTLGALSGGLFLLSIYGAARWAYGEAALGFGDVLLGAAIGAMTGPVRLWPALALGMGVGGAVALTWRRRGAPPRTRLPYGACLIAGAIGVEMWRLATGG